MSLFLWLELFLGRVVVVVFEVLWLLVVFRGAVAVLLLLFIPMVDPSGARLESSSAPVAKAALVRPAGALVRLLALRRSGLVLRSRRI